MIEVGRGRVVGEFKPTGVEFFADVPVKFQCGCRCTDNGACSNDLYSETEFSTKVMVLSFLAMLSVMFIHSSTAESGTYTLYQNSLLYFFGTSLTSWAVPFFFCISGYFFWHRKTVDWKELFRKKFHALLIPYLVWALIGTLLALPLVMFNNYVLGRVLLERTVFESGSVIRGLVECFGIDGHPIGNVPLWYVRSLISIFIMAPVLVLVIRRMKWLGCCIACFLMFVIPFMNIPYLINQARGLGYFYLGMMLSEYELVRMKVSWKWILLSGLALIILLVDDMTTCICTPLLPLALGGCLWVCYDVFVGKRCCPRVPWVVRQTFWVYCFHMIPMSYLLAIGRYCLGKGGAVAVLMMFVVPVMILPISLLAALLARKFTPRVFQVLTGGRGCQKERL